MDATDDQKSDDISKTVSIVSTLAFAVLVSVAAWSVLGFLAAFVPSRRFTRLDVLDALAAV